jgi:rare lipoprotein A
LNCLPKRVDRAPLVLLLVPLLACSAGPEFGDASWYGYPYHGRRAAGGEIYDMEQFTAAHRTLPFGTHVRVVNLANRQTVDVRINDRGPFVHGRVIDLSKAAARAIGLIQPGVSPVRLEVLDADLPEGRFAVQIGAFRDSRNAARALHAAQLRYRLPRIVPRDGNPVLLRVLVGSESDEGAGRALARRILREGGAESAWVVRLDVNDSPDSADNWNREAE